MTDFSSSILPSLHFESINIINDKVDSIHLLDEDERLLMKTEEEFMSLLNIKPDQKLKVVSIFGNTGDGKSFTLNHTFFEGKEVFRTSPSQFSCTIGVWAKYNPDLNVLCLDTEGFLGVTAKENQRTRLLLKILAISDVIIYRTKSERLQRDMYSFLGGASTAYKTHFSPVLEKMIKQYELDRPSMLWGPSVVIFHETTNTETLHNLVELDSVRGMGNKSPEEILKENFYKLNESYDGFSSLNYVGFKNDKEHISFAKLRNVVLTKLNSSEVRSPRSSKYIFLTLKALNEKFQSHIYSGIPQLYISAFFTCQEKCLSCGCGCALSMGHVEENESHHNEAPCKLQHQYQNFIYYCKKCLQRDGKKIVVEPCYQARNDQFWSSILSTVWSGYKIECEICGIIYQSREYWYGNKDPKADAVEISSVHVWSEQKSRGSQNSAQRMLDGVTSLSNAVASVGSQPTKMISDWMSDQIAPPYWRRNAEIQECLKCKVPLETVAAIHHCRDCGEGFCEDCSSKRQPVPLRGWEESVRVCDFCYKIQPPSLTYVADGSELRNRRIGESVISSIYVVKSFVVDKPKELIKDIARPAYWTPDSECDTCVVCGERFSVLLSLHHCRDCGKGVCDKCSPDRKPVPLRGWDTPVRVCRNCSS